MANPKKPPQIENILRRNKDKLLAFLRSFHNDKEGEYDLVSCVREEFAYNTHPIRVPFHRRAVHGTSRQDPT